MDRATDMDVEVDVPKGSKVVPFWAVYCNP